MHAMDAPQKIDPDMISRYALPVGMAGIIALVLAVQELDDAGRAWSWRYVCVASLAGMALGVIAKGAVDAAGLSSAWDAPAAGVAGAVGIKGLSIMSRWLRARLESLLSAALSKVWPGASHQDAPPPAPPQDKEAPK